MSYPAQLNQVKLSKAVNNDYFSSAMDACIFLYKIHPEFLKDILDHLI